MQYLLKKNITEIGIQNAAHLLSQYASNRRNPWPDTITNEARMRCDWRAEVAVNRSRIQKGRQLHYWICHTVESTVLG